MVQIFVHTTSDNIPSLTKEFQTREEAIIFKDSLTSPIISSIVLTDGEGIPEATNIGPLADQNDQNYANEFAQLQAIFNS